VRRAAVAKDAVVDVALYSSWLRADGAEHQIEASYELVPGEGEID
jgi:hypothetical protein